MILGTGLQRAALAWIFALGSLGGCSAGDSDRGGAGGNPSDDARPAEDGDAPSTGSPLFDNTTGAAPTAPTAPVMMGGKMPATNQPGAQPVASGVEPAMIDNCPGALSADDVQLLQAGGPIDPSMRFLYPYDGTVFPRGLEPPILQWDAAASGNDAVYVHLSSAQFDFKGCYAGSALGQATIPADVWQAAFRANEGVVDPLLVEVTTLGGGNASGPIGVELTLARATLKGSIFYNTYSSPKAATQGVLNGVVMRVTPGQPEPELFVAAGTPSVAGDVCVGCHSVSADGTRMVVEEHSGLGITYNTSTSFALEANQTPRPPPLGQLGNSKAAFSALYPDGSRYLTTGRPEAGPFSSGMSISGTFGVESSALWETDTGNEIPDSGIPQYAKMPMFNPDGDMVVFNDQDAGDVLAIMDFDPTSNKFSNHRVVADDPKFIGWPFFLPDSRGVVYALTDAPGYTTIAGADLTGLLPNNGELRMVELATNTVIPLARAMGYSDQAMAQPFVPGGERDLKKDYIPTVSPVAAGGYFWLFFTSKRTYGNIKNLAPTPDSKQIWVSAISISGTDPAFDSAKGLDPSHPPFRLPGQELESGNIRAFATLNPCKADGESCETGIDCCGGFCTDGVCGIPVDDPPRCSEIDEGCDTVADCCDAGKPTVDCIAGFCAYIPVLE